MEESKSKKVGRPKKVATIPTKDFKGIVKEGTAPDQLIRWSYTAPKEFKTSLATFKTCGVEFLYFYFTPVTLAIKGMTKQLNNSDPMDNRYLKLRIDPSKVNSYFCRRPCKFKIAHSEWLDSLEDMDESCAEFVVTHQANTQTLKVCVRNDTAKCSILHDIAVTIPTPDEIKDFDTMIERTITNEKIIITNIRSDNLKKMLGKPSRKNCQYCTFRIAGSIAELEFTLENGKITIIEFPTLSYNEYLKLINEKTDIKKAYQVIKKTNELFDARFPNINIHKFLTHIKDTLTCIHFINESVVIEITEADSTFWYYIPIA